MSDICWPQRFLLITSSSPTVCLLLAVIQSELQAAAVRRPSKLRTGWAGHRIRRGQYR